MRRMGHTQARAPRNSKGFFLLHADSPATHRHSDGALEIANLMRDGGVEPQVLRRYLGHGRRLSRKARLGVRRILVEDIGIPSAVVPKIYGRVCKFARVISGKRRIQYYS